MPLKIRMDKLWHSCSSEISYISENEWAVIIFNNIWQPHKDNVKERSKTQQCLVYDLMFTMLKSSQMQSMVLKVQLVVT